MSLFVQFSIVLFVFMLYFIFNVIKKWKKCQERKRTHSEATSRQTLEGLDERQERKIRKHWLIGFLAIISFSIIGLIFTLFFEDITTDVITDFSWTVIWSMITYHCAYKKRGTGWLMFNLIMTPIQLTFFYLKLYFEGSVEELIMDFLVITPLIIYFWINSFRLRKCNMLRLNSTSTMKDS